MTLGKQSNEKQLAELGNATTALLLLKEWLSISESQICSTEVLSEHLPKINQLLESSMNDISTHFGNVATSAREIDAEVAKISSQMDVIDIDGRNIAILEYIESLASATTDKATAKNLDKLVGAIKSQENSLHSEIRKVQKSLESNASELSQIVVGMQFQDRVSQNILITINIMKAIAEYLDKEISTSMPNVTKAERKKLLNMDFAKELLQKFRLGELQHSFVNHLVSHGYISSPEELGFSVADHVKKPEDDDVELF
jgi:hypothetical protein